MYLRSSPDFKKDFSNEALGVSRVKRLNIYINDELPVVKPVNSPEHILNVTPRNIASFMSSYVHSSRTKAASSANSSILSLLIYSWDDLAA